MGIVYSVNKVIYFWTRIILVSELR